MTRGVMAAARGDLAETLLPLALVWSNGLVVYLLAAWIAKRVLPSDVRSAGRRRPRQEIFRPSNLDRVMNALVFYLDRPTRILVVKDFRTFRRDPTQWALLVLFAILMLIGAPTSASTTSPTSR